MIQNYIEFKYVDNELIAVIHKEGKHKLVTSEIEIARLKRIARKYGYEIDGEKRIVRNAREIREEFDKITYKLKRKSPVTGKRIVAMMLATTAVIGTIKIFSLINDNSEISEKDSSSISIDIDYENKLAVKSYDKVEFETINDEMKDMIKEGTFNYSYEDRSNSTNIQNVNQYDDIFQKYAKMYGVDTGLLKAIAAQESGGDHYGNLEGGQATGIMQIENMWHIGYTTCAYNVETQETDSIDVDENNIKDIETNIRLGAMILSNCLEYYDYNIPLAIQAYNFGIGNVDEVITYCATTNNQSTDNIINTPSNNDWIQYRSQIDVGDPQYLEHVLSYLGNQKEINIVDKNGIVHSISIENDYTSTKNNLI